MAGDQPACRGYGPPVLPLLLACAEPPLADTAPVYDPDPTLLIGGERPATVQLPEGYAVDREWPLVVLLHGYGATSTLQEAIFALNQRVDALGFILVKPEGTVDSEGSQFWNATEECCDFDGSGVDDVAYLSALLDEARSLYPVSTVALVGHSNGGYMSYRLGCETPDRIDRIVVLAGATYKDEVDCLGTEPVSVWHVHGTIDDTVAYASDEAHAGAEESVGRWVAKAGCDATAAVQEPRDYLRGDDGAESTGQQWSGCGDVDLQLWTAVGGDHYFVANTDAFKDDVARWVSE